MSNSFFRFKEFMIHQENSSLKVSTDSCLFGAWLADIYQRSDFPARDVLDIGAGTALLALMFAQKNPRARIEAIEIDENSYRQACANVAISPWAERVTVFQGDVKLFPFRKKFDLILSNPPFFEGSLRSGSQLKNIAKHDEGLLLEDLIKAIRVNIKEEGMFAVLLPFYRVEELEELAADYRYYPVRKALVKQTMQHDFFRGMLLFSHQPAPIRFEEITIKGLDDHYTENFIELLKDYYLYL